MRVEIYWIGGIDRGRLGTMPRPQGGDWLEDEVASLRQSNVGVVVSLLEPKEIVELELEAEQSLCEAAGILYLTLPIVDRSLPRSEQEALEFARILADLLDQGKSIVIHCRQGIGRSTLMAAIILAFRGMPPAEAFERIERARGCVVPDTRQQRDWIYRVAEKISGEKR